MGGSDEVKEFSRLVYSEECSYAGEKLFDTGMFSEGVFGSEAIDDRLPNVVEEFESRRASGAAIAFIRTEGYDIDEDYLSEELVRSLRDMIRDRESFGFEAKRRYDDESYYGIKDEFFNNWPWPGASNFSEPIIPTMVDVGSTHIHS